MQIYKKELKIYERTLEKFYILEKSCKFTEKKNITNLWEKDPFNGTDSSTVKMFSLTVEINLFTVSYKSRFALWS